MTTRLYHVDTDVGSIPRWLCDLHKKGAGKPVRTVDQQCDVCLGNYRAPASVDFVPLAAGARLLPYTPPPPKPQKAFTPPMWAGKRKVR